ncbi:MAG TPA: TatD family hydrolase [Candidatus Thermoplasmatota archaeon]
MPAAPRVPCFDDHFHLDPEHGDYLASVEAFARAGGTHFLLVHKPDFERLSPTPGAYEAEFRRTLKMGHEVNARSAARCVVALCPHPAEFPRQAERLGFEAAFGLLTKAVDLCASIAREDPLVVALSEAGRPHYPVSPEVWAFSNRVFDYELAVAKDAGLAAQLHTESATPDVMRDLAAHVEAAGMDKGRVSKHYCPPHVLPEENHGLFPSVLASRTAVKEALAKGDRFMLETDFIDDRRRPGAVMGPATVPRRTRAMLEQGVPEERVWRIHKENPERVYGVEITL